VSDGHGVNKGENMKKFKLKIFMEGFDNYNEYVGGPVVVICNGINITKHDESKSESIVSDHYFSVFDRWLKALPTIIGTTNEVRCSILDNPFDFVFKRHGNLVDVTVHYMAAGVPNLDAKIGGPIFDKKMGGKGKPIAVPQEDFVTEVLDKANYFINFMREKNPKIADDWEFQSIVKRKKECEKAWTDYLGK
jgi:hypothetical protein